jgi:type IV secretion system protein VirB9
MKSISASYLQRFVHVSLFAVFLTAAPVSVAAAATSEVSGGIVSADSEIAAIAAAGESSGNVLSSDAFDLLIQRYQQILGESADGGTAEEEAGGSIDGAVHLPPREPFPALGPLEDPKSAAFDRKLETIDGVPPIRPIDRKAIDLAESYDSARNAPDPNISSGRINFFYGTMNPRIICRPLRLTDIELEPGEQISNVHISDPVRWSVSGSWSGPNDSLVTHVLLKPQLPDISANLLIHTDRRTYSIDLVSVVEGQFMPYVGFIFPEVPSRMRAENEASWRSLSARYQTIESEREQERQQYANMIDPAKIYFDYTIKVTAGDKKVSWKPTAAYDVNGKTYITMPEAMNVTEAPALFIKQGQREKLVNYRVDGNLYIVDRLFNTGVMVVGKDRVAIIRKTPVGE